MAAIGLHHVLMGCPAGSEDLMREFDTDIVGLPEITRAWSSTTSTRWHPP